MGQGGEAILELSGRRISSPLALGFMYIPILLISSSLWEEAKKAPCVLKPLPHPSSPLCSHPPAWREVHDLFQRKLCLGVQQSRSFRAVFLTSEPSLLFYYFFSQQQPRSFCQNVFSTCSLLVMLSVLQICYQCH